MYKIPLRYQATEYDCGSAAIINAINYSFDFSEIPVYFLKKVYEVCLDEYSQSGVIGGMGTSVEALEYLCSWFNRYKIKTGFGIECKLFKDDDVTFLLNSKLLELLKQDNTSIVIRCMLYNDHYITLTYVDDDYIYAFDPYYWGKEYGDERIIRVDDPFRANRKFPINFMDTSDGCYSLNTNKKIAVSFTRLEKK